MRFSFKKLQRFIRRFDSRWDKKYRAEGEKEFSLASKVEDVKVKDGTQFTELELWWRDDPEPYHVAVNIDEENFIIYTKYYKKDNLTHIKVLRDCSDEWKAFNPNAKLTSMN